MSEPTSVTKLLAAIEAGDASAWDALLSAVYAELRRLAAGRMRRESGQHTFVPTVLVHEAYLRLLGEKEPRWRNRADFFAAAAEAMRRILVEHARRRSSRKRGGRTPHQPLWTGLNLAAPPQTFADLDADLEALDAALVKFERDQRHRDKCATVKLRYFAGLTIQETAEALGKSVASVKRDWAFAKAWLYREMTKGGA